MVLVSAVSSQTSTTTSSSAHVKKGHGPLADRVSSRFDWKKALALTAIAVMIFTPYTAVLAAAPALYLTGRSISQVSSSSFSSEAVSQYQRWGFISDSEQKTTPPPAYDKQAEFLHAAELKKSNSLSRFTQEQRQQRTQDFVTASATFLNEVKQALHPIDRAIRLHQAGDIYSTLFKENRYDSEIEEEFDRVKYEEAIACEEAAHVAENTEDRLSWLLRGVKQLSVPEETWEVLHAIQHGSFTNIDLAISLWKQAGEAYVLLLKDRPYTSIAWVSWVDDAVSATSCFQKAVRLLIPKNNHHEALALIDRAITILKNSDLTTLPLAHAVKLQEEIADLFFWKWQIILFKTDLQQQREEITKEIYTESLRAYELYTVMLKVQPRIYFNYKRATNLQAAARFAPTSAKGLEIYKQALAIASNAYKQDPHGFLLCHPYGKENILSQLQSQVAKLEKDLTPKSWWRSMMG